MIDIVHAITYSIMLLNTDLHIAEISTRMSRSQFVKNTLSVVLSQINQPETNSPFLMPAAATSTTSFDDDEDGTLEATTPSGTSSPPTSKHPTYRHHPKNRSGSLTSWRSIMQHAGASQSAIQLGGSNESPVASRVSLNLPTGDSGDGGGGGSGSGAGSGVGAGGYFDSLERRGSRDALSAGTKKLWEQEMEVFLKVSWLAVAFLIL